MTLKPFRENVTLSLFKNVYGISLRCVLKIVVQITLTVFASRCKHYSYRDKIFIFPSVLSSTAVLRRVAGGFSEQVELKLKFT